MASLHLKIIKPEKIFLDDEFDQLIIPGIEGDFGVLPGHTPFITKIRPGLLSVFKGSQRTEYAIHEGFVTVENDEVTIVTEVIETPEQIDIKRAEEAKKRAEERLKSNKSDIDYRRAELALKRAFARLELAKKK